MEPEKQLDKSQPAVVGAYKIFFDDLIGEGNQSKIYRGSHRKKNFDVAVKVIDRQEIQDNLSREMLQRSLAALLALKKAKHILSLYDITQTQKFIYIVTQLCQSDLQTLLQDGLTEEAAWGYLDEIIKAFGELFNKNIVHRDIKPANIFIDQDGAIKLGDFGFAATLEEVKRQVHFNIGSPVYMAPETLLRNQYSHQSDIWAIGISFYQILTGNCFWSGKDDKTIKQEMNQKHIEMKLLHSELSERAITFLSKVLVVNRKQRIKPYHFIGYFKCESSPKKEDSQNQKTYCTSMNQSSASSKIGQFMHEPKHAKMQKETINKPSSKPLANLFSPIKPKNNPNKHQLQHYQQTTQQGAIKEESIEKPDDPAITALKSYKVAVFYQKLCFLIMSALRKVFEESIVTASALQTYCPQEIAQINQVLFSFRKKVHGQVCNPLQNQLLSLECPLEELKQVASTKQYARLIKQLNKDIEMLPAELKSKVEESSIKLISVNQVKRGVVLFLERISMFLRLKSRCRQIQQIIQEFIILLDKINHITSQSVSEYQQQEDLEIPQQVNMREYLQKKLQIVLSKR